MDIMRQNLACHGVQDLEDLSTMLTSRYFSHFFLLTKLYPKFHLRYQFLIKLLVHKANLCMIGELFIFG